jgi:hypothetical protein
MVARQSEVRSCSAGARWSISESASATASSRVESERCVWSAKAVFAGIIDVPDAGSGAAVPLDEFEALGPQGETGARGVVDLVDGADPAAFVERVECTLDEPPTVVEEPVELERLHEIDTLPLVLSAFLVAGGLVAVGHALVVSPRPRWTLQRRRRLTWSGRRARPRRRVRAQVAAVGRRSRRPRVRGHGRAHGTRTVVAGRDRPTSPRRPRGPSIGAGPPRPVESELVLGNGRSVLVRYVE